MEILTYESFCSINNIDYGENVVVFLFGGDWCTPCKKLFNNFKMLDDCIVYKINVENLDFEDYITDNNIISIPHSIFKYKKNHLSFNGERSIDELKEMISTIKIETIAEK